MRQGPCGHVPRPMLRTMLQAKLHRGRITACLIDYEGSLTVDLDLIEQAGLLVHQQIQIYDITNGARFETYLIAGPRGSGAMAVNGAAARLVMPGDRIIVCAYSIFDEREVAGHKPVVLLLDDANRVVGRG